MSHVKHVTGIWRFLIWNSCLFWRFFFHLWILEDYAKHKQLLNRAQQQQLPPVATIANKPETIPHCSNITANNAARIRSESFWLVSTTESLSSYMPKPIHVPGSSSWCQIGCFLDLITRLFHVFSIRAGMGKKNKKKNIELKLAIEYLSLPKRFHPQLGAPTGGARSALGDDACFSASCSWSHPDKKKKVGIKPH